MSTESYGPGPGGILAYVDEQGNYDHVLRVGRTLARETDSPLFLYESEPVSTGVDERGEGPLGPDDLLRRDRSALAEAVARAREEGIDAWGWIASADDPEPLVTCADALDAGVIVLPVELEEGTLPTRWREERLEVVTQGSVSLVVVDRAGHLVGPA
jgi:hypothetical protein